MFLLSNLIETCLKLKGREQLAYEELMKKSTFREARQIEKTWADEMMEQGEARGEARGEAKGMLKILCSQIKLKFGPLPSGLEAQLAMRSPEQLQEMSARVLTATTLSELLA